MMNGASLRNSTHICLGVCTYKRPEMLLRCLLSIRKLKAPEGTRLSVIIVDNEAEPTVPETVETFGGDGHPFHYVHEPRRGIAQARNAILDKAAELKADWIAMLDDDQMVDEYWLDWMWHAAKVYDADVVQSTVQHVLPDPLPRWAFEAPAARAHWKFDATWAATCGVLFRTGLLDADAGDDMLGRQQPLRFDERYALTGGEDRDFFTRAHRGGARIIATPYAVATEFVPASKLTFSAQVARCYTETITVIGQDREQRGRLSTVATYSLKGLRFVMRGAAAFLSAPFAVLWARRAGRKQILKGSRHMARAAGCWVGLVGMARPEQYRITHGG